MEYEVLDQLSQIGEHVYWETLAGIRYQGVLTEWDSNVAIVNCDDGTERAVET